MEAVRKGAEGCGAVERVRKGAQQLEKVRKSCLRMLRGVKQYHIVMTCRAIHRDVLNSGERVSAFVGFGMT